MAKGAKSGAKSPLEPRPAAEAKRAGKTGPSAKKPGAEGPASRAKPAAKRNAAEAPPAPRASRSAAAAKPAAPVKASKSKAFPEKSPAAAPAKRGKTAAPAAGATARSNGAASAKPKPSPKAKPKKRPPPYLAAELGQPVDHEGEPIGAGSRAALADTELQHYTLQLWRQMQSRRGVNLHVPAMERAGVTIDQIWTAGVTDTLTTSSSPDDVRRYKQKLLFRANLLEAILTETVGELHRLNTVEPAPARPVGEPG